MNYKVNLYVENSAGEIVEDSIKEINVNNPLSGKLIKDIINEDKYLEFASESLKIHGKEIGDNEKALFPFLLYEIKLK